MILRGPETLLVQGITGRQGSFWTARMQAYGTQVVGGVNPRKAGIEHCGVPVYGSAVEAARAGRIDASVLFIPPLAVRQAALDAIEAGIEKLVILTEHVPVQDVMYLLAAAREAGAQVLGPNTAGAVTPGECFVGFMPAFNARVFQPGPVGVVSRSGSLGTLVCLDVVRAGYGVSAFIGIGGDPILGTTTLEALRALDRDDRTEAVVIVGEIGGAMEEAAADYAKHMDKPIVAFIAGAAAPTGKRMGHAGAIILGDKGSFAAKRDALEAGGATVVATPTEIGPALKVRLG
jgi:succinyl-CoA synthetase alpha subunit